MVIDGFHLFFFFCSFVAIIYSYVVAEVIFDWKKNKEYSYSPKKNSTTVSVIIPARNEELTILKCLESLVEQEYDKNLFEVIVVDDNSEDETVRAVGAFIEKNKKINIRLIQLGQEGSGKKSAIKKAIDNSEAKLIITSDADCWMNSKWLSVIVAFYQEWQPKMILGPVLIDKNKTNLQILQRLELMSLTAFTAAFSFKNKPIMSNGANLAYEREIFQQVNGFEGIDDIASGDDVLLMNKIQEKFPGGVRFLKSREAIVFTDPVSNGTEFVNQRKRWVSKGLRRMNTTSIYVAVLVSLIQVVQFISLILSIFYGKFVIIFLLLFTVKFLMDLLLMKAISVFFDAEVPVLKMILLQLVYVFSVILILAIGTRGDFQWKGRTVR